MARGCYFAGVLLVLTAIAQGNMYDIISPLLLSPDVCGNSGCANWSELNTTIQSWWTDSTVPIHASNHCAQLSSAPGLNSPSPLLDPKQVGSQGAWCVCENNHEHWGYCTSPEFTPEQVNLQYAGPTTIVVSFVTFEPEMPSGSPVAVLMSGVKGPQRIIEGVTHVYTSPSGQKRIDVFYQVIRKTVLHPSM